jgi:hypothetical protein
MTRKQDRAKKTNWKDLMSEQEDFLRPLIREVNRLLPRLERLGAKVALEPRMLAIEPEPPILLTARAKTVSADRFLETLYYVDKLMWHLKLYIKMIIVGRSLAC